MNTPALIGLAHGSRHPETAASLQRLMDATAALAADRGLDLEAEPAFLDLTEPDLVSVAAGLREQQVDEAIAVPLLFTSAFHATVDVPQAAREAIEASGLGLHVAPILGTGPDVLEVLDTAADEAGVAVGTPIVLYAVGSSDQAANEAVRDLAGRLGERRRVRVRATFGTRPPRGMEVLASLADPVAVVTLFTAPGLLLDPMLTAAHSRRAVMTPPLETRLAPLVLNRYLQALTAVGPRRPPAPGA